MTLFGLQSNGIEMRFRDSTKALMGISDLTLKIYILALPSFKKKKKSMSIPHPQEFGSKLSGKAHLMSLIPRPNHIHLNLDNKSCLFRNPKV